MKGRRMLAILATMLALALIGAACGGDGDGGQGDAKTGGILRIQTDDFIWDADLDPTGEYLGYAHEWFTALHRTLLSVNHKKGGNEVKPDLASAMPEVSSDGLTYTFKIKSGVKFAPPVNRAMTSKDIVTRHPPDRQPGAGGDRLPELLPHHRGVRGGRGSERQGHLDLRHHDARRLHDRLQADGADRRLPVPPVDAGDRSDAGRDHEVLDQGEGVRALPDRRRPLHDRRRAAARHHVVRDDEADLRVRSGQLPPDAAEPELRRRHGLEGAPVELHRRCRHHAQHQHRRYLQPDRERHDGRQRGAAAGHDPPEGTDGRGLQGQREGRSRRPDLVPVHEHGPAAVRRSPRP